MRVVRWLDGAHLSSNESKRPANSRSLVRRPGTPGLRAFHVPEWCSATCTVIRADEERASSFRKCDLETTEQSGVLRMSRRREVPEFDRPGDLDLEVRVAEHHSAPGEREAVPFPGRIHARVGLEMVNRDHRPGHGDGAFGARFGSLTHSNIPSITATAPSSRARNNVSVVVPAM